MKVKMDERKVKLIVNKINEVLDENFVYSQEFLKEIIKALILSNLNKNKTVELLKEIEGLSISSWQA